MNQKARSEDARTEETVNIEFRTRMETTMKTTFLKTALAAVAIAAALGAKADEAYVMAYHKDCDHSLHLAVSDDGRAWRAVNGDRPVVDGRVVALQKGIRDPHIVRAPDGTFLVAATDLHVFGQRDGLRETQWERDRRRYDWGNNRALVLLKSRDLIEWTHVNLDLTKIAGDSPMKDVHGNAIPWSELACAWAPEAVWDDETGSFLLHFTCRFAGPTRNVIYAAHLNADMTGFAEAPFEFFTAPKDERGFPRYNVIDSDIVRDDDGVYHFFYVSHERGRGGIFERVSKSLKGPFEEAGTYPDPERKAHEAPSCWRRADGMWVLMYDCFGLNPHDFGFVETPDFKTWRHIGYFGDGELKREGFSEQKHGAVVKVPAEIAHSLEAHFAARPAKVAATVEFLSDRIVHVVRKAPGAAEVKRYPVVTMKAKGTASPKIVVERDEKTGLLTFKRPNGEVLLSEKAADGLEQMWQLDAYEAVYGLGIWQDRDLSRRGKKRRMIQSNVEDFIPFWQSSKGYGVFWDNASPTTYEDTVNGLRMASESGEGIDYYFLLGDSADGVNRLMRELTGRVPLLPKWTYGYWISRERYTSWKELLDVLDTHRKMGIPLDGVVQDWQYWGGDENWNAMDFLIPAFQSPAPADVVKEVHDKGAHLMITIWPDFGPKTQQYAEFKEKDMLMDFVTWPPKSGARCYDVYSPEARDIYWKYLKKFYDLGIDAWWMDSTDPDHVARGEQFEKDLDCKTVLGPWRANRNAFPLATVEGVYDHQLAEKDNAKRVTVMTRSVYAGMQRTGANTWSGDVVSRWDLLRKQIAAGLGMTMCGNPNFNSDAGGFFAGSYSRRGAGGEGFNNPRYQELYTRWLQFAAFNPLMRSHGTGVWREIYFYGKPGEPVYDTLLETVRLRYRILPYTYSLAGQMWLEGGSFMRAFVYDFPEDPIARTFSGEFLYGPSILVAPVAHAMYTDEAACFDDKYAGGVDWNAKKPFRVYLPKGADWWEFDNAVKHEGGRTIEMQVGLDTIPLFMRAGSIIPLCEEKVDFAAQQDSKPVDIAVYPGADAEFLFYDDAGDGFGYEKGEYAAIRMRWDDKARALTLADQEGTFRYSRAFRVRIATEQGDAKSVEYTGKSATVNF